MWQSILYPPIFVHAIDMGLSFLFGWHSRNMSTSQKLAAYPHLYSYSSVKSVVHWFQIMRTKSFQMYDDDVQPVVSRSVSKYTKVAKFPTRNIKTPIVLVYGGSDSLVDIKVMLKELPHHTIATEVPHFEHLDFLWAREVDKLVFPHVFDALESFCDAKHSKEEYDRYRTARHASIGAGLRRAILAPSDISDDEGSHSLGSYADVASAPPGDDADALVSPITNPDDSSENERARKRARIHQEYDGSSEGGSPITPTSGRMIDHGNGNAITSNLRKMRSGSIGSSISFESKGSRGISIGVSKAVSGVVKGVETLGSITTGADDGSSSRKKGKK